MHHVMHQKGFCVIDYIDDCIGVGFPDVARASFASLFNLMNELGLTISDSRLVAPSTKVVCLGVLIDTENGTVSIPPDKLRQINDTVRHWSQRTTCTKRQLQSLLGLLLYVHKCVKPARAFLNRMLALLRAGHASQKIHLTTELGVTLGGMKNFCHCTMGYLCMTTDLLTTPWNLMHASLALEGAGVILYTIFPYPWAS